jgi:polysaccharide export outer membrane protein
MKKIIPIVAFILLVSSCSTKKELSYLNNLDETGGENYFTMEIPDYKVQPRDILYVSAKTQTPDGMLQEIFADKTAPSGSYIQSEASQYIMGFSIDPSGFVTIPLLGKIAVEGMTIYEIRDLMQARIDSLFRHAYVEVRLLSFKFTVIGEVRVPGSYVNYNDQLTVLEGIGRAGGITETGAKERVLVIRPTGNTTTTYQINLQDKNLLASPAYFLKPNDVIIVQPTPKKTFNVNLPTYAFIITTVTSAITTTLLLIDYFGN